MHDQVSMKKIARICTEFPTKFGIPRQSGLVQTLHGRVVFEPEYRVAEALRGMEGFSHIWLLWQFSQTVRETWSPTVRPPRLGGNKRMGVFATRSPYRPNAIGLSCVRLERVELHTEDGPVLYVAGADLMDGTPIFDIKPYLPYADSHPEAVGGFAEQKPAERLHVERLETWKSFLPEPLWEGLCGVLSCDPRPPYQDDPRRMYDLEFGGYHIKFTVEHDVLTVHAIAPPEERLTPEDAPRDGDSTNGLPSTFHE